MMEVPFVFIIGSIALHVLTISILLTILILGVTKK